MSIKVKIPAQLRSLAGGQSELEVTAASNVRELLDQLVDKHPGLVERVVDEQGQIRRFVNVYNGDEDVRFQDGLQTKLQDGATVSILPAVAGGA